MMLINVTRICQLLEDVQYSGDEYFLNSQCYYKIIHG